MMSCVRIIDESLRWGNRNEGLSQLKRWAVMEGALLTGASRIAARPGRVFRAVSLSISRLAPFGRPDHFAQSEQGIALHRSAGG